MPGLSALIENTMQQWQVPGLAIAIVQDNQIICCEGFGLRDINHNLKVTAKTLFAIGSCTKAFTTMAMGILVDRGLLDWDKPVRNYLPSFKLFDSYTSEHITPRDLVTHRSGLPRHDAMWYGSPFSREEIFHRLQYLEPTQELRTTFQYQNLMYMTAGYLVGQIANSSWEEFVQQEILHPLGMADSNFSVVQSQTSDDFALPYKEKDDQIQAIPFRNIDVTGPAGSINSNVTDMAQWILLHLNQGKVGDRQIISTSNLKQMHAPQIVMPDPMEYDEILHPSYGLGWFINAYRGHNFIQHGGNIDGFSALTTLLPQDNLGLVILTNLNPTPLPYILTYCICDRLLNLGEIDWSDRIQKKVAAAKAAKAKTKAQMQAEKIPGTQPSHPLEDYTGNYEHPAYGIFSVELKDNQLISTFNSIVSQEQHYHYDTFESKNEIFDETQLTSFFTDKKGNISSVALPIEPALKDMIFTKIPDKNMSNPSFLSKFVGEYQATELPSISIALRGNCLIISVPSQPDIELVPYQKTEFNFKDLPGFSIKFNLDDSGEVNQAVITQPYGIVTAVKK